MPISIVALLVLSSLVMAIWAAAGSPRYQLLIAVAVILTDIAVCLLAFGTGR